MIEGALNQMVSDMQDIMKNEIIVVKEDGVFIARHSFFKTVSQGSTVEEATKNLEEATKLYLEEFPTKGGFHD